MVASVLACGAALAKQPANAPFPGQQRLSALAFSRDSGAPSPSQVLHVAVSLQPSSTQALENFANAVSDPASPLYRQFMTPEQIGANFGASQADINAVVGHLKSYGFKVTLVASNRLAVLADGTVRQAEAAFGTTIRNYSGPSPDGKEVWQFHANRTPILVPAPIADRIVDVSGLESYSRPTPHATTTRLSPDLTRGLYQTSKFYGSTLSTGIKCYGQGRTIGISNWDGFKLSNVDLFITKYSLPVPPGGKHSNVQVVTIDGGSQSGRAQGEGDLDIQMVIGMAPLAKIKVFDGRGGDLVNVLTNEANDGSVDIISESYGWNVPASTATGAHDQHLAMTIAGKTYMAASGDSGTTLEPYSYPNYEPEVLQIGGTVATVDATSGARTSEVGWSGSGGGWSTNTASFNVKESWQNVSYTAANGNVVSNTNRWCPDVALHADGGGVGGFYFYYRGQLYTGSGTSFSSPIFAGSLALAQQKMLDTGKLTGNARLGKFQVWLYGHRSTVAGLFTDITSGNNGKLPDGNASDAKAGWDFVTGLGAMDFNAFVTGYVP